MTESFGRHHHHGHPWTVVTLTWTNTTVVPLSDTERRVTVMTDVSMQDNSPGESAILTITDALGQEVAPAAPPTWSASDGGTIITLTAAADGMSAEAVPVGVGSSDVSVTATDADGTTLTLITTVTVTAGPEANLSVAWSPIVPAPPAPPAS